MHGMHIKQIPYGAGDYESVRNENDYYVDKTMYIPEIEKIRFNFLIRPRRFGKTLFLSTLQTYYDMNKADRFEDFFRETWILDHPTDKRNAFMILYFNFSMVRSDINLVEESFNDHCNNAFERFLSDYKHILPQEICSEVRKKTTAHQKLETLSSRLAGFDHKIYLLIDEYDNFTNTIVAQHGENAYNRITREDGFFKDFFKILKGAASGSGSALERMFITGVSPITMDDVTSGFNVGNNITIESKFSKLLGFTESDVREMLNYYADNEVFHLDRVQSLGLMKSWYDGYNFSTRAGESVFNTDMVLYFLMKTLGEDTPPDDMIDENVRIDYGKLRHFLTINRQLNGNFDVLETILTEGGIAGNLVKSFPYRDITERDHFISLLFYFGLITLDGAKKGEPWFSIPNNVIKELMLNFIRRGYEDIFEYNLEIHKLFRLTQNMAYDGEYRQCMEFIAEEIASQITNRDLIDGEKAVQAFFMSLLNISRFYVIESEKEANRGYADLAMLPFTARFPDMKYAYLIEFKYIKVSDYTEQIKAGKIAEARKQLEQYASDDKLAKLMYTAPYGNITLKRLIIIFKGSEMVHLEEVTI